jgi:uncharacterized membrane protein
MDICEPRRKLFLQYLFYCCVPLFQALPRNGSTFDIVYYLFIYGLFDVIMNNSSCIYSSGRLDSE